MSRSYYVDETRPFFGQFWPEGVPHQIDYDASRTLYQMLHDSAEKWPDYPVLWFLGDWTTYQELNDQVCQFAAALQQLGVKKQDRIALHLPNCPQFVIAYYAIVKLGAIVTPINPTYHKLEILHQLQVTEADFYIGLDALYEHYIIPILDQWAFRRIIHTNLLDLAKNFPLWKKKLAIFTKKVPAAKIVNPIAVSFLDCLKKEKLQELAQDDPPKMPSSLDVEINPQEDVAVLLMTGGTTGEPKAAMITHENCCFNADQCVQTLVNQKPPTRSTIMGEKTGQLGILPLYHSFAMTAVMNCSIDMGGWIMLFPKPPPTEELLKTFAKVPDYNGFIYFGAEILFKRLADLPQTILDKYPIADKLELCVSGAGPLHEYVRIPFEEKTGVKIREGYGLTEASPVVSCNNFFGELSPGTIGVPFPGTDWGIFPIEDFSNGPIEGFGEDHTGEICVCSPIVMKGYYKNPAQTADNIKDWNNRRWLLTGDIGFMDQEGRITIRDRKKQLIKVAGHSVFPKEVENLIGEHPKVLEVAVAGLPDMKTGEAIKAWIALKPEFHGTPIKELKDWMEDNITYWKCPKYIEIVHDVPKNAIGKVMRRTLQEADPIYIEHQNQNGK